MSAPDPSLDEDEASGAAWRREVAASPLGRHELLHTASIVMRMFETHVLEHPAVEFGDDELKAGAERALEALLDFYQLCGSKFIDDGDEPHPG